MAKDRDDELNKGPSSGEETFSLEEIMAEFGAGRGKRPVGDDTIPFPTVPSAASSAPTGRRPGKVVSFPGAPAPAPAPPEEKVVEFPAAPPPEEPAGAEAPPGAEVPAPASDNPIAEGLNRLMQKADDYAGHMFEEEGAEQDEAVRRAERYIPGTDEEAPEQARRERRKGFIIHF